jgi:pimeloyl-ACP methyl ester carboxylesterase
MKIFLIIFSIFILSKSFAQTKDSEIELDIFFIRGLTRESEHSETLFKFISDNCKFCNVVSFDIPGNGKFLNQESFTNLKQNTDFLRSFWSKNPKNKSIVLGVSLGGMIVLDWLKRYPSDFDYFFVANSSLGETCSLFERIQPENYYNLLKVALPLSPKDKEEEIMNFTLNIANHKEQILKKWVTIREKRPVKIQNVLRQLWAAFNYELEGTVESEKLKILVSKNDKLVDWNCSKKIAYRFNSKIYMHETAGHDITTDDPLWVLNEILKTYKNLN